ncbi:Tc toxin subunit A [Burkholderia ubonensis]|uniref:Tc toxin subunit A n=1 Tax=Burkholderia ubonensis TaxID=101571 RepID=UPI00075BDD58|nr:Tc toxin subunit A [Burkholderia ubonensis]KWB79375.1 hypothetical protein WL42_12475 [Burkholderia ubonensis]
MTRTSPLISRIEDLYQLEKTTLATLGYASVFDVVRVPRERFTRQHRNTLGRRAEKIYDLAIGYAHQVSHAFRHSRVTRAVNAALSGPFSKPGPDYTSQFLDAKTGWKDKAPSGAPEANDGPVAYLTHIYHRALQEESAGASDLMNKLSERRPDIGKLVVDNAALNQEIPQIQLVNEVLGSAIQGAQKLSDRNGVNTLLSTTRYPNTLPFHFGSQQIRVAESTLDVALAEHVLPQSRDLVQAFWAINTTLNETQASDLARLQIMASQLAPEQQKIVTEDLLSPNTSDFYKNNYGADISSLTKGAQDITPLLEHTGLTIDQVVSLIGRAANSGDVGPLVVASPNVPGISAETDDYAAVFINHNDGEIGRIYMKRDSDRNVLIDHLSNKRLDRINRIIRLQKWLGLSYEDVDLLISSTIKAEGSDNATSMTNDNTLRMLGVFKHYQSTCNVSPKQFAAWLYGVTPYAITPNMPFFDQIFNSSGAFDTPFVVDNQDFVYTLTTGDDSARVKKICAALGLNHRQFLRFADQIARQQGDASLCMLNCNLSVVSAFYRLASMAKTLDMVPDDFYALVELMDQGSGTVWKQLAGQPTVMQLQTNSKYADDFLTLLQAFSAVTQWLQKRKLSASTAAMLVQPYSSAGTYCIQSFGNRFAHISVGWKDLMFNKASGEWTLIQQLEFKGSTTDPNFTINQIDYTLPPEIKITAPITCEFGNISPDSLYCIDNTVTVFNNDVPIKIGAGKCAINVPCKINGDNFNKLNKCVGSILIVLSPNEFLDTFNFCYGSIYQGTNDQLSLIREVWQHVANTFVDAVVLSRCGAKLVDDDGHTIDWLHHFSDDGLIDLDAGGLVTDADIASVVSTRVNRQTLTDDEKQQAIAALTGVLTPAKQTQQGVATSLLAKTLEVQQSLAALLLRWNQQSPYQWLKSTWALRGHVQTPTDIPAAYLIALADVARRALVCQQFSVSPAALQDLLDNPGHFWESTGNESVVNFWTLHMLSEYDELLHRVGAAGGTEDDLLAYLQAVNASRAPSETEAAARLASLFGWTADAVQAVWKTLGGIAQNVPQLATVTRLQQAEIATGLTVGQQQAAFALSRESSYDDWRAVGQAMIAGANHVKNAN